MDFMDDFVFGPLNFINRAEGLVRQKMNRCTAVRFSILRIDKGGGHTRGDAREILKKYGVPIFGTTHDAKCLHFLVKSHQAAWAEYLLLHAGVELQNPPVDPKNYTYVEQHQPGWMPSAWADREKNASRIDMPEQKPTDIKTQTSDLTFQVNRVIDWIDQKTW